MGQHHALGRAAGARGVDEAADVGAAKARDYRFQIVGSLIAGCEQVAPADQLLGDALCDGKIFDGDDEAQVMGFQGRRQHAFGDGPRRDDDAACAPLWLSTWRWSATVFVVKAGTVMAPIDMMARSAIGHSGRFSATSAMRSPGSNAQRQQPAAPPGALRRRRRA